MEPVPQAVIAPMPFPIVPIRNWRAGAVAGRPGGSRRFPADVLRWRNDRAAAQVGLAGLSQRNGSPISGGSRRCPAISPAARAALSRPSVWFYNPDLGDGRGFTFAQMRDGAGA
jgi:uncharacterized protein YdiU (UPF0061 family)